jgi:hypothetical protein
MVSFSLLNVPALVFNTRWKVYSVSTANPEIFVDVISLGLGIEPALVPFLYKLRERSSAVASSTGSHSSTTEVCVAFLQRSTGGVGACTPNVWYMVDCKPWKAFFALVSEEWLRETVMSTMEPEEMSAGRRMEGNSI